MNGNTNNQAQEYGYLEVQVFTATGGIPISGAQVVISKIINGNSNIIKVMYTNSNGKTEILTLPAPPMSNSMTPDSNGEKFSIYNIKTTKEGFVPVENINVPIFSGQRSIQPVNMLPLDELKTPIEEIYEQEPTDL